jgi:hypothetical protein
MSAALYIVFQIAQPGFDTFVDGKALSRAEGELASMAAELGVRPLMEFFSMSREEAASQAEAFNTGLDVDSFAEDWFTAAEGLETVRALLAHVDAHPDAIPASAAVANELTGFVHVLEEAEKRGLRWHLAVDY